jgi:hypothetical protein
MENMENNYYKAPEGKAYQRIIDGLLMGDEMYLYKFIDGSDDIIENYILIDYIKPLES